MSNGKNELVAETGVGVVRSLLAAVPFIGTLLTEVTFDIRSRIKQKRFEEFVDLLSLRIEKVEKKLNPEGLKTDEFIDLWEDVVHKVTRNRSKEKLNMFCDIMASSMCKTSFEDAEMIQMYLSVLDTLAEPEFKILDALYKYAEAAEHKERNQGEKLDIAAIDYSQEIIWGLKKQDFRICVETLISKGLAYDDSAGRLGTRARTFIKPTPLALGLMKFIKDSHGTVAASS